MTEHQPASAPAERFSATEPPPLATVEQQSDTAALSRLERFSLSVCKFVNERPQYKRFAQSYNLAISRRWMTLVSERRIHLIGTEVLRALEPDRGVLLAANHRSFFDMYMILTYLVRNATFCRQVYFPVRSSFWYDNVIGLGINAVVSGMAMYPPVFREPEKRGVSRAGLDFLAEQLRHPGNIVGMHPEGTRSKHEDPYELLPPERGFGRVVLQSQPIVLPIFINGMGNDLAKECWGTMTRKGKPIIIAFGEPVDLQDLYGGDFTRLRSQMEVGKRVLGKIADLAATERRYRSQLSA